MRNVLKRKGFTLFLLFLLLFAGRVKEIYALNPDQHVGAYFFYWHDCPYNNWNTNLVPYHPYGTDEPYPGTSYYYSSITDYWYEVEVQDMKYSGIDYIFPICWGNHPLMSYFRIGVLSRLVQAIIKTGSDLKIGLFDDTTSECCEWNYNHGRGYGVNPPMDIRNSDETWCYFYDLKIKPFFETIPQALWATHNGEPVHEGGRPVIVVYTSAWFTGLEMADEMWAAIKYSFARDFKDKLGKPVTPWIVLDSSWFYANPSVAGVADGRTSWGAALWGSSEFTHNGYSIAQVGPGYDDRLIRPEDPHYQKRDDGDFLVSNYQRLGDNHLILVETWNELWEGTAVESCYDYPREKGGGGILSETHYMELLRSLRKSNPGVREYDFTMTWFGNPAKVYPGDLLRFKPRNDGTKTWSTANFKVGSRYCYPAGGDSILTEFRFGSVKPPVPNGSIADVRFVVPYAWQSHPGAGSYTLKVDMVEEGVTWFVWQGDTQYLIPLEIVAAGVPDIVLTAAPRSTSLHRGETLYVDATLSNKTSRTVNFYVWINVEVPGKGTVELLAPRLLTLDTNGTMSKVLTTQIPLKAPTGVYTYDTFVGALNEVWSHQGFNFNVVP